MSEQNSEFAPSKAGMAVETKMGMGIVVILVCAFGFLVYHKFDLKQRALLQASMQGNQPDLDTQDSVDSAPPTADPDFDAPQATADFSASESTPAPVKNFGGEPDQNAFAATETRPAFEFTEPASNAPEANIGANTAVTQTPSNDPFAALAAKNAARLAQEEAARAATDDPFASIPTPTPEPKKLFAAAAPPDESPSSIAAETPGTPTFPAFGAPADAVPSTDPDATKEPVSLAATTINVPDIKSARPSSRPSFDDAVSAAFDVAGSTQESEPTPPTKPRPLPPVFPDVNDTVAAAEATTGQDLPPVSSPQQETADSGAAPPLHPVDDSSRQLIAMLEPSPGANPFNDSRPARKPGPALFSVSDEQNSDSTTTPEFQSDTSPRPTTQNTNSDSTPPQNDSAASGSRTVEVGVARFHNPRQIQQTAGASDPCEICEVKVNDNYWSISKRTYGTARYYSSLALYNKHRISDPKKLRPGMKVLIPDPKVLEERYPEFFRNQQRKSAQPSGYFLKPDGTPAYRVGERETLSEISQKHLGRASRWIQIYRLNQQILKDPNRLKLGTVIMLPDDATDVHLVP